MNILSRRVGPTESVFTRYLVSNKRLLLSFAVSLLFVFALVYVKAIAAFLQTAPLTIADWVSALLGGLAYLLIYECVKWIGRIRTSKAEHDI